VALGTVLFLSEWAWTAAERSFQRALGINSAHTEGLLQYGSLMEALGRFDDGLRLKHQALERDSRSTLVLVHVAMSYWHQRKYQDAATWARRALEIEPRNALAGECLAGVYWASGDFDRFLEENVRRAVALGAPESVAVDINRFGEELKRIYERHGRAGLARRMVAFLEARQPNAPHRASVQLAVFCGEAGNLDEAFAHLDRAIAARDPALVHLAVAPQWDTLRHDARFTERLKHMALR
jgi:tetratricopeptide (TPR) repeat protein